MDKDIEFILECFSCLFAALVTVTDDKAMAQFCFARAQLIAEYIEEAKSK